MRAVTNGVIVAGVTLDEFRQSMHKIPANYTWAIGNKNDVTEDENLTNLFKKFDLDEDDQLNQDEFQPILDWIGRQHTIKLGVYCGSTKMTLTKRAFPVGDGEGYEENFLLANKQHFIAQLWSLMPQLDKFRKMREALVKMLIEGNEPADENEKYVSRMGVFSVTCPRCKESIEMGQPFWYGFAGTNSRIIVCTTCQPLP